jgi:hypothetical protein
MKYILADVRLERYQQGTIWKGCHQVDELQVVLHQSQTETMPEDDRTLASGGIPGSRNPDEVIERVVSSAS